MTASQNPPSARPERGAPAAHPGPEPADATVTPVGWRVAAGSLLVGGFCLGLAINGRRVGRVLPLATAAVAMGSAVPVALASRRPPISPRAAARALDTAPARPTFSVVVAARDEAAVLRQLVEDVAAQDYRDERGEPRYELVVVDDRSTDGTADAVRMAAAAAGIGTVTRVILRRGVGIPDGKGAALTAAQPETCRGDVVVVLDADARIQPWFLTRAAGYFAAGARAVTARRRILDAGSGWLEGAQADEQTLDGELNRGRWALGGCSEFRGNGIMIRRDLLAAAGGWRAAALTEDVDLASRIAALSGERVAWAIDAEVWEEPVRSFGGLWKQRLRWAEGALRRLFEHGPAVLASPRLTPAARLDFVVYAGQLAVPSVVAGAFAGAVMSGRKRGLATLLGGYLGASALLAWDSLRWERLPGPGPEVSGLGPAERARRTARITLFNGLWLLVVPRALADLALRKGPIQYVKMEHRGAVDPGVERSGQAGA
jgi:GT2 family glycosyltransferase